MLVNIKNRHYIKWYYSSMPELPEVETVRRQLERVIVGRTITDITSLHPKTVIGNPVVVKGKTIRKTRRFGKMIVLDLDGDLHIAVHLKMSGQLLFKKNEIKEKPDKGEGLGNFHKHTRAVVGFADGDQLLFNDQRVFGWVRILTSEELESLPFLRALGPEPWDTTDGEFHKRLSGKRIAIKLAILDQSVVSGAGNIYANDALWLAKIHPKRPALSLTAREAGAVRSALVTVMEEGIEYGGSTGQDGKYVHVNGESGQYQNHFKVYDRKGEPCLRHDGGVIEKIKLGGRGTYFCPSCQK